MRRAIVTALIAVTLAGVATGLPDSSASPRSAHLAAVGAQSAKPQDWRYKECRFQSWQRGTWTPDEERLTALCAVAKWPIEGGYPKLAAVIACESGWNRWASNGGRYVGLAQHMASAYVSRVRAFEPPTWHMKLSDSWPNSRGHIVMTVRMIRAVGWSPWACA